MAFANGLEFVRFPGIEREFNIVSHLFSYCDESGKEHEHDIVVFNSLVDNSKSWENFSESWMRLLRHYHLNELHAKEALRYSQPYGTMKPGTAEERAADIMPFVRAIVEGLELGVVAGIDVRAYKLPTLHKLRLNVSEDPHYFAFFFAKSAIMQHLRIPKHCTVGLILDDDEGKSIQCYKFWSRLNKVTQRLRQGFRPSVSWMTANRLSYKPLTCSPISLGSMRSDNS